MTGHGTSSPGCKGPMTLDEAGTEGEDGDVDGAGTEGKDDDGAGTEGKDGAVGAVVEGPDAGADDAAADDPRPYSWRCRSRFFARFDAGSRGMKLGPFLGAGPLSLVSMSKHNTYSTKRHQHSTGIIS